MSEHGLLRDIGSMRVVLFVVALVGLSVSAWADTVRMRSSAVVDADRPVVVSDVAVVEGDEASKAAGAVIAASPAELVDVRDGVARVTIEAVKRAMAESGVMLARVGVSGNACVVRIRGGVVVPAAPEEKPDAEPAFEMIDASGPVRVRTRVVESIARTYGVEREAVRVVFDPRDEPLLSMEEGAKTVIVRPMTTGSSARPVVEVRVVSGERTVASGTVGAEVEIRKRVVVAVGDIARHSEELASLVRADERWMAPGGSTVIENAGAVLGQRASRRIRAGEVLRQTDVEGIVAVRRGEVVVVECIRNGVSVQTRARALGDGRIGDRVECRLESSAKSFVGTVDAVGRVVVHAGAES
jgi:flagella basal body P-ring formation protein FlgA